MDALNHTCILCGTKYHACDGCEKMRNWKSIACSISHYQQYMILINLRNKIFSEETAYKELLGLGVDVDTINFEEYADTTHSLIKQIQNRPSKTFKNKPKYNKKGAE